MFSSIDSNGDGEISKPELIAHLAQRGYDGSAASTIFATLDVNGDGAISQDELRD